MNNPTFLPPHPFRGEGSLSLECPPRFRKSCPTAAAAAQRSLSKRRALFTQSSREGACPHAMARRTATHAPVRVARDRRDAAAYLQVDGAMAARSSSVSASVAAGERGSLQLDDFLVPELCTLRLCVHTQRSNASLTAAVSFVFLPTQVWQQRHPRACLHVQILRRRAAHRGAARDRALAAEDGGGAIPRVDARFLPPGCERGAEHVRCMFIIDEHVHH